MYIIQHIQLYVLNILRSIHLANNSDRTAIAQIHEHTDASRGAIIYILCNRLMKEHCRNLQIAAYLIKSDVMCIKQSSAVSHLKHNHTICMDVVLMSVLILFVMTDITYYHNYYNM